MKRRLALPRMIVLALMLAGAAVLWPLYGGFAQNAQTERGVLADLISKALSTPTSQVSIGAVEGALSSDATIRDIVLSDRDGPYLRLDRARLIWRRTALLLRRLEVDRLEIGKLEILRKPAPQPAGAPVSNEPILPELPLKVVITAFQLGELSLGQPVIGVPARIGATGSATLGPPSEGLDLRLEARRLDAPGEFSVRLGFVPQSTRLQVAAKVDEPQGGLIARIADLPGQPPVKLDLNGDGPLDAFRSNLTFTAGETIGAQGSATLSRAGAARQLALALDARIEGLMPAPVAPVFSGSTKLDGTVGIRDDGGVDVPSLALVSALARLDVQGRYGADKTLDFHVTSAALPNTNGRTVAAGTEIGKLAFDATIVGPATGPRITATLDSQDLRVPQGKLDTLSARFTATPNGSLGDSATKVALVADGEATGVALADAALARFVGDRVGFTLRGTGDGEGNTAFETLRLAMSGVSIDYKGQAGNARVLGQVSATLPDLSRLSGLAGRTLAGKAELGGAIDGVPRDKTYAVTLSGRGDAIVTGDATLDRLLAGAISLAGKVETVPAGGINLTGLRLAGQHVALTADGAVAVDRSNLKAALTIPDLKRADPRLSGRAAATVALSGPQDKLDAVAQVEIANATALGRPIPRLAIEATIRDLQGALDTKATLAGEIEGKPASGTLALAREPGDIWNLSALDLAIGSVRLGGALKLDAARRAAGRLTLAARNLDDLSALALTKLGGEINADLTLTQDQGRQNLTLNARGARINAPGVSLEKLTADVAARDIYAKPALDAAIAIDRAIFSGEPVTSIRFDAKGNPDGSDFTLSAGARGLALNGAGRLVPGEPVRLDLTSFEARRDGRRIALSQPSSLAFPKGGVTISGLALAVDGGKISIDGKAGETLDLHVAATAVPLSAARLFAPKLDLSGTLDADARIAGRPDALTGPWRVKIARLVTPETRGAGLPPVEIAGSGQFSGRQTSVDATLAAGRFVNLTVRGTAPLSAAGALNLSANGRVDAALANALIAAQGQRVTGALALDLRANGTASAPRLSGQATFANGSFTDALQGVKLSGIEARIAANGETLTIERATARTGNGGTVSVSGSVKVDPGAGFPGALKIQANRAELVSNGIVTAVADLALDLSGPLAQRPRIAGRVDVVSLDVAVPDRLPSSLRPVDGIRHVNAKGTAAARLAAQRKAKQPAGKRGRAVPAFDAALAITVSAPNRVFIRGRGIDAELGGELRVGGSSAAPSLNGGFELRRGRLSILAQRLDFSRGRLTFNDGVIPDLDFVAETRASDVTARIIITGPANQPAFAFTSQPELPQDEVLSRLLFAKTSGSLSPFQALQLAQTVAQFSGAGGDDAFERLRKSLGVDNLDIQVGAGGPTVGASRYIGNNVTLGVKAGAKPEDSGVSIGIDFTRRLKLQAETGADGSAAVGVGAEWEY